MASLLRDLSLSLSQNLHIVNAVNMIFGIKQNDVKKVNPGHLIKDMYYCGERTHFNVLKIQDQS